MPHTRLTERGTARWQVSPHVAGMSAQETVLLGPLPKTARKRHRPRRSKGCHTSSPVPGPRDRAPSRHQRLEGQARPDTQLFPVLETGLHRGTHARHSSATWAVVCSRSSRPGSIAAWPCQAPLRLVRVLFPVLETGLHRGLSRDGSWVAVTRSCSRSSRPGSIAATSPGSDRWRCRSTVPGPRDRAPSRPRTQTRHPYRNQPAVPGPRDRAPSRPVGRSRERQHVRVAVPGPRDRAPSRPSPRR